MTRAFALAALISLALAGAADAKPRKRAAVDFDVTATQVSISNGLVSRTWSTAPFRTLALTDQRGTDRVWSKDSRDFALVVGNQEIGSELFSVATTKSTPLPNGGTRLELGLIGVPGLTVTRVAEIRPGIAAIRMQTILTATGVLPVSSVVLEEAAAGSVTPTAHTFRAGADWRDANYTGPELALGDPHGGTWRATQTAAKGGSLAAPAQWLTLHDGEADLAMIAQGTDFPSNRAAYDGAKGQLRADYGHDVILLGPIEEQGHIENPTDGPGRARIARPGRPLAFDPVIVAFGDHDGDVEWQVSQTLRALRGGSVQRLVFNSDKIDANQRSTGAKDDMDIDRVREIAPIARELGLDTFVLDDGWQARSGDWCPDSPQCPEPRSTWSPRYPDSSFKAVREALGDDLDLGLWMTPLHFHPSSNTFAAHPEWVCQPVGTGLLAYNKADETSSSNEAGTVEWSPAVLPHIEERLRIAIEDWKVRYFKFDFIAWLDCADQGDLYDYRDAFVAMLDRLRVKYPHVTFTIDETNDYRLFPFVSTSRGATWFQNGNPELPQLLHNLWNLSPYVPAQALGQNVIPSGSYSQQPTGTWLSAALPSHMSFFTDIRKFPADVRADIATWTAFYKAHRERFSGVVYPLLDDPIKAGWTALQTWDPEAARGALLAFRQTSSDATRTIAMRNIPAGRTFRLRLAPTGETIGTATSADLVKGLEVEIPEAKGALVVLVEDLGNGVRSRRQCAARTTTGSSGTTTKGGTASPKAARCSLRRSRSVSARRAG
jgi:hypothetical protein